MKAGFTGTREGLSTDQHGRLYRYLCELPSLTEFRHGACVGADEEAVEILFSIWMTTDADARTWKVIAHPCDMVRMVSATALKQSDVVLSAMSPLGRNRVIVNACDLMIACPKGPEERRSGTWSTVRYGRKQKKRITIIWPNGNITEENP